MVTRNVGYEFLRESLGLRGFAPLTVARVDRVTRVTAFGADILAVPPSVAPGSNDPLEHVLFALKHEDLHLQLAMLALQRIPSAHLAREFMARPTSQYARQACFLWEIANSSPLEGLPEAGGPYVELFDPQRFLTGAALRNTRWRVDFNGIGSQAYCITVRRTAAVQALLAVNILEQVKAFVDGIAPSVLDRAVRWAYLSETDSSYAIERESASNDKRDVFAALLARAHEPEPLTEDYLVSLQNLAVSNPLDQAFEFRSGQNWLRNNLPGALGITYLPPPPGLGLQLMDEIMSLANCSDARLDTVVRGSLLSFAFVFAHPFKDGNGRLSRFLFHKAACQDARLTNGLVLPVSMVMKRNEEGYLQALQSFSRQARSFWDVVVAGDEVFATFTGAPEIYRYWDGTACVEFGLRMSQEALERDLRDESDFLYRFDRVYRAVNAAVDMNNNDLVLLVRSSLQNQGLLSSRRRKQLIAKGHPEAIIDAAALAVAGALAEEAEATQSPSAMLP